ncbi:MAG: hypothetical protein A3H96_04895 [Acidobacteria bacterium RIFCSPLOWO2_02_FULL_67_36]|nr:MAG: hypothetical protein A3H96_04895 [Acidobacteria bacterium RIFCSPLOWO2_02_FULL_67_36]OFW26429.1 MAG: hypothetical protein A3G21_27515 [Acidobacteria bacterium RIFCSPLOWO2_12_FULL_66_21]
MADLTSDSHINDQISAAAAHDPIAAVGCKSLLGSQLHEAVEFRIRELRRAMRFSSSTDIIAIIEVTSSRRARTM